MQEKLRSEGCNSYGRDIFVDARLQGLLVKPDDASLVKEGLALDASQVSSDTEFL